MFPSNHLHIQGFPQTMQRSRGSSKRSSSRPLGEESYESVQDANRMVGRVVILLLLCQAKRIWWLLEQPVNSLLEQHPLFQAFLKLPGVTVQRYTTSMFFFGGPTRKPTWLYSSCPAVVFESICCLDKIPTFLLLQD